MIEDGGLHVVAVVIDITMQLITAGDQLEGILAELDVLLYHPLLGAGDQRPHVGGLLGRVTNFDLSGQVNHSGEEPVMDAFLHQQPGGSAAGLSGVAEHAKNGGSRRGVHVGIIENHVRSFTSQLQADPLDLFGSLGSDALAGEGLPGEGDLVHLGTGDDLGADHAAGPRYQVEHTRRDGRLVHQLY